MMPRGGRRQQQKFNFRKFSLHSVCITRNDPKYSDRQVRVNSEDPDYTSPGVATGWVSTLLTIPTRQFEFKDD